MKLLPLLLLTGCCLAHRPADSDPRHLAIRWAPDFEAARDLARRDAKPLLVILIAGDLTESC